MRTALVWEAPDAGRQGNNMRPGGRRNLLVYTKPLRLFQARDLVQGDSTRVSGNTSQRESMPLASSGFFTPLSSAFWAATFASAFLPLYSSTFARFR